MRHIRHHMILRALILLWLLPVFAPLSAQVPENPFAEDVRRFSILDSLNPPPKNAVLFLGSSSFTLWKDVPNYFPGYTLVNRAFGGSKLIDQIEFIDQLVLPYQPRQVVIYCGENDFAASDTISVQEVVNRFIRLTNLIRDRAPNAKITYISMKPSPSRWYLESKFRSANDQIKDFLYTKPNTSFVNIWDKMLNKELVPDSTLFLEDRLHMNAAGYNIWQKAIIPHLIK